MVFTHLELRGADEVAHILYQQQIEAARVEPLLKQLQAATHHCGIEMAGPSCGDRHHGNPDGLQAFGVQLGGHVALQHRHLVVGRQGGKRAFQQGRFAGTGTAHQVEAEQIPGLEMLMVVVGLVLVGREQVEAQGVLKGHMHG